MRLGEGVGLSGVLFHGVAISPSERSASFGIAVCKVHITDLCSGWATQTGKAWDRKAFPLPADVALPVPQERQSSWSPILDTQPHHPPGPQTSLALLWGEPVPKARAGPCSPLLACCSCRKEEVGVSTAGIPTPTLAVSRADALILQHMAVLGQLTGARHRPLLAGLRPTGSTAVCRGSVRRELPARALWQRWLFPEHLGVTPVRLAAC